MADITMIKKYLAMADISLGTDALAQKFGTLLDLLKEWNEKFNLTSITDDMEVVIKHFVDSLMLVSINKSLSWQTIIDIGTGAGFPGVPLAIVFPDKEIFLSDANGKKITFLKQAKESLALKNITIIHGRSEDLSRGTKFRENFDMAAMRALAAFPVALELSSAMVKPGGKILYYASAKQALEVNKDLTCFKELGCQLGSINQYVLPEDMGNHTIISVNKLWKTSFKYPRAYGIMKRKPL